MSGGVSSAPDSREKRECANFDKSIDPDRDVGMDARGARDRIRGRIEIGIQVLRSLRRGVNDSHSREMLETRSSFVDVRCVRRRSSVATIKRSV